MHRTNTAMAVTLPLHVVVLVTIFVSGTLGYPTGAPVVSNPEICTTLTPGHGADPQTSASPFTITPLTTSYDTNGFVQLRIEAAAGFTYRGLILQARPVGSSTPVGTLFAPSNEDMQVVDCLATSDTLTHVNNGLKSSSVNTVWVAPATDVGDIEFVATFVSSRLVYWVAVKSGPVYGPTSYCRDNAAVCQNNGVCYDDDFRQFRCDCSGTGYTGPQCIIKKCLRVI